ncbi:hypothetical protein [Lacinutrix undariae]
MKLSIYSIVFLLISSFSYAQKSNDSIYVYLNDYNDKYKTPLTKADSLSFFFHGNDTLVKKEQIADPKRVNVPYEYKDSTFLKYYTKVAFRTTGIDSVDNKQTMRYWKSPIKIFFSKSISPKTKRKFMSFAKSTVNQIDSLQVSEVKHLEDSNYPIYIFGDYEYNHNLAKVKTSNYDIRWNGKQQIYKGGIKIDTKRYLNESLVLQKLKELFIGSLGHFKLLNAFNCESYFSNCYSPQKKLTSLDLELLKYHYSYGICKGVNLECFNDLHYSIKKRLEGENHIHSSITHYNE